MSDYWRARRPSRRARPGRRLSTVRPSSFLVDARSSPLGSPFDDLQCTTGLLSNVFLTTLNIAQLICPVCPLVCPWVRLTNDLFAHLSHPVRALRLSSPPSSPSRLSTVRPSGSHSDPPGLPTSARGSASPLICSSSVSSRESTSSVARSVDRRDRPS